jgi:hypothetical protein
MKLAGWASRSSALALPTNTRGAGRPAAPTQFGGLPTLPDRLVFTHDYSNHACLDCSFPRAEDCCAERRLHSDRTAGGHSDHRHSRLAAAPALNKAKLKATGAICLGNQKQINSAYLMYADDSRGTLLPTLNFIGPNGTVLPLYAGGFWTGPTPGPEIPAGLARTRRSGVWPPVGRCPR